MNCKLRSSRRTAFVLLGLVLVVWSAPQAVAPVIQCKLRTPAQTIFAKALWIYENATFSNYDHNGHLPVSSQVLLIDENSCSVNTNCSGFVGYVLYTTARAHFDAIRSLQPKRHFPQAKSYAQFFTSLSEDVPHRGWLKIASIADLRRGDLIAWQNPGAMRTGRGNTGHVMFVAKRPGPPEVIDGKRFVSVFVLDCSSVIHFKPERFPSETKQTVRDGVGMGVIRLLVDENDKPIGYWEGTYSQEKCRAINSPTLTNSVAFARPVNLAR